MKKQIHVDKKVILGICVLVVISLTALYGYRCVTTKVCPSPYLEHIVRKTAIITLPQGSIEAQVADTSLSREKGFSGTTSLAENKGMLFVFGLSGRYGFWMKDMLIPLDIIWINQNGVVVKIVENAKPEEYPRAYINDAAALYVLEIAAGQAHAHEVYLGTKVTIKYK